MLNDDLTILSQVGILKGIRPDVLGRLLETAVELRFAPGEILISEGDIGRTMMVLLEGRVEVVKGHGADEMLLSYREVGEVFGEMAFFEAQPRFATVRAVQPVRALELCEAGLEAALVEQPELLYHTTKLVSARLRDAQQQMIADLQRKNQDLQQAYFELKEAHAALVEKERLERELELARQLQQSILPTRFPPIPGFTCAARSRPARQVGGDFYDVFHLGDRRIGLVMADVSDKGFPAALFMALSRSLIRAEARRSASPRQVLLSVNKLLQEMSQSDMFVTVFYGVLDLDACCLRYVRAGHDRPLLYHASSSTCDFLTARGTMLGLFEAMDLEEVQIDLAAGDRLVLYTDGVTDANSPDGEFFGSERLSTLICQGSQLDPHAFCNFIFEQLDVFQNNAVQYDDMAVMVVMIASS